MTSSQSRSVCANTDSIAGGRNCRRSKVGITTVTVGATERGSALSGTVAPTTGSNRSAPRSVEQRAQRLDALAWMPGAPQLVRRQPGELPAKDAPRRLARRIALGGRDAPKREGARQGREEHFRTGLLRREIHHGDELLGRGGEPVREPPQVDLELGRAAAPADHRGTAANRGTFLPLEKTQGV